jgi:membrane protein insertase Oxa1/YidC/SpoIIIJ
MANILYMIIIYPITQVFEFVFVFTQKVFKETGLTIICISGVVSVICLPLYMVAENWQEVERNIQKRLATKIAKIKAVFSGDERYMILSAYYRQNHYHPIYALRSSFGLLIQIPFFIAAYSYLSQLQALQGVSFLFINDLGKPDALLPIAGGINFLPILMTLINCAAGALYTRGLDIKDKVQIYGIALVFLVLLYNSSAALVLYWTLNNLFSLAKNLYLKLPFRKKHFFLFGIISIIALILSYYVLFIHNGSLNVRILIAVISIIAGTSFWITPFFIRSTKKIKHIFWTSRETLFLFISSLLIMWIVTGVFLPSMLIGASPQEFSFIDDVTSPLFFIFNTSVQSLGLFIFWPLVLYFLFPMKIKKIFSISAVIVSFSALCNMFFFSGDYGLISSDLVFAESVSHNLQEISINISVLAILSVLLFSIYNMGGGKKILSFMVITVFIAFIPFSIKNLYFINTEFKKLSKYYVPEHKTEETISPIFHLSKTGKNVLVIMLDAAKSVFVPYIFEESPELYQKYEGFVYYPNTVTFNGWTKGGAPPIFGGYEYTPQGLNNRSDISLQIKRNESLLLMPALFSSYGFSVVITDPPYADDNWIPDLRIFDNEDNVSGFVTDGVYTDLWLKRNNSVLPPHSEVLKRNILWYAVFREIPLAFRQAVYYVGSWCATFSEYRMRPFLNGYAVLDYLDELTGFEPKKEKSAVLIVNNTTHDAWFLQAPLYKPQLTVTNYGRSPFSKEVWYHANVAAIKRLSYYFDFLRLHEVYDNTRIILVSDHGQRNVHITKTNLPFNIDQFNPFLLVKDFNVKGAMKTDMTFMTNADVPALAMKELIENPVNPFTGNTISTDQKNNPLLILTDIVYDRNENEIELNAQNTYYVHGNIFDEMNWIKPEKYP